MSADVVETFVREARTYCRFVETASELRLPDRLQATRDRLLTLYSAALSLPSVKPDDTDASASPEPPTGWPGFEETSTGRVSTLMITRTRSPSLALSPMMSSMFTVTSDAD
jgi:hypothetical protein